MRFVIILLTAEYEQMTNDTLRFKNEYLFMLMEFTITFGRQTTKFICYILRWSYSEILASI